MKTIIAGSRKINDYELVKSIISECPWEITGIVSGTAYGIDQLGERYAEENNLPLYQFPADWKNLEVPGAIIKRGTYGLYNVNAGFNRNKLMAEFADALIAIWDGKSRGTKDMISVMKKKDKLVFIQIVRGDL